MTDDDLEETRRYVDLRIALIEKSPVIFRSSESGVKELLYF
jgi:hypothetical protein